MYLRSCGLPFLINDKAVNVCKAEIKDLEQELSMQDYRSEMKRGNLETKKIHLEWMKILDEFAREQNIPFEFLIIYTNQFNSGFRKQEFENIHIIFPELREPCKFGEVSNVLKSEKSKGEKFFFLYYNRAGKEDGISITNLVERMLGLANRLLVQRDVKQRLK